MIAQSTKALLPGDALALHREELKSLAAQHNISHLCVFGSVARHDDTANSDVDLLATFVEGSSLYDLAGFQQAAEELLGTRVDVISRAALKPELDFDILADARAL